MGPRGGIPQGGEHSAQKKPGRLTALGNVEQLAEDGLELGDRGNGLVLPLLDQMEHLLQFGGGDGHGHVVGVELNAQPSHDGGGRGGFGLVFV